ncbi:MAG: hypothetical protein LBU72_00125 [Burkholderiaceae bacterium]|jgi:hypothetical protein|nr:hypothetical protein [Burkholderiaceae bacterium]
MATGLKFFFDANLSPHLARGINGFTRIFNDVEKVVALADKFPHDIKDVEFIERLSQEGTWCNVSCDPFTKRHGAEREAIRRGGHTVFVLTSQWTSIQYWQQAERLVRWWPQIVQQARMVEKAMFSVPFKHSQSSKFKQISM